MDRTFPGVGTPGEQVAAVDFADVRSMWEDYGEIEKKFFPSSSGLTAIAGGTPRCSDGADIRAVGYRMTILKIVILHFPEVAAHVTEGQPDENLFRAIAEVPMTWIGEGAQEGLPFDEEVFLTKLRNQQA